MFTPKTMDLAYIDVPKKEERFFETRTFRPWSVTLVCGIPMGMGDQDGLFTRHSTWPGWSSRAVDARGRSTATGHVQAHPGHQPGPGGGKEGVN